MAGVRAVLFFLSLLCSNSTHSPIAVRSMLWLKSPLVSSCAINGDHRMKIVIRPTPGACALECYSRLWCNSFHFTAISGECKLCSLHYLDKDVIVDNGVTKYYRSTSGECSVNDGFIWDRETNMCIHVTVRLDLRVARWQQAVDACANRTLRLVSPHTPERLDFLVRSLRYNHRFQDVDFFIGAKRPTSSWNQPWPGGTPDFKWIGTGTPLNVTKSFWADGQPDNRLGQDNVIVLKANNFLLTDTTDSQESPDTLGYVCEK